MKRPRSIALYLVAASVELGASAQAQEAAQPCGVERAQLQAERTAISRAIADIALGRTPKPKKRVKAGDVSQAVLGTAASVLLPFGLGAALNMGVSAARKGAKKAGQAAPAPSEPDVPALIARERLIDERLAGIEAAGCAAGASPPSASRSAPGRE